MITLVIPFYNEEAILADAIQRAAKYLAAEFGDYELILVDDGSTDSSLSIARQYESDSVRVLTYKPNRGKGYAVRMGTLAARGEAVFFTDADLPYGLEALRTGYDRLTSGCCDLIVGSRNIGKDGYESYPPLREVASHVFVFMVNAVLGLGVSDSQCGLKGFTRPTAQQVFSRARIDGFAFDMEALYVARNMNLRIEEMPVRLIAHGDSKVRVVRDSLRMIRDLMKVRFRWNGCRGGRLPEFLRLFLLLYPVMCLRFLYYGFRYFHQLDDYIQYFNYEHFGGPKRELISRLGLLAARPLAGLADLFVWAKTYDFMIVAVLLLTALHAAAAVLLYFIFRRHFGVSLAFLSVFCLIPTNFEGTYWVSASSRILCGLFFAVVSGWFLQRFADYDKWHQVMLFAMFQLVSFGFYEQAIFFSLALTFVIVLLNFRAMGRRTLWALVSLLNLSLYMGFTWLFRDSRLYGQRIELALPNTPYYFGVFLPGVLQQLKSAFLGGGFYITWRGFFRGLGIVLKDRAWGYPSLMLCAAVAFFVYASREEKMSGETLSPKKGTMRKLSMRKRGLAAFVCGALLAAAPVVPFFFIGNPWLSIRSTVMSFAGIALMAESLLILVQALTGQKGGVLRPIAAAAAVIVFLTGSVAELHDYRMTTENDVAIVRKISSATQDVAPGTRIAILNLNPSYLAEQSYFYHEHIHGVTESKWALTGALRAVSNSGSVPSVTPIASTMHVYWDYDSFGDYELFYLFDANRDLALLRRESLGDGLFDFYDMKGNLRARIGRDPNGRGILDVVENRGD